MRNVNPFFLIFFLLFFSALEASFHCMYTSICTLNTKSRPINTDYFLFGTNNLTQDNFHQYGSTCPSIFVYINVLSMYKYLIYAQASCLYWLLVYV